MKRFSLIFIAFILGASSRFGASPKEVDLANCSDTEIVRYDAASNMLVCGLITMTVTNRLVVPAGIAIATTNSQPTCDATARGLQWYTQGGLGIADVAETCGKNALNVYSWKTSLGF